MDTIKKENEKRKKFSEHLLIAIFIAIGVALPGAVFVLAAFKDLYAEYVALFVFGSLFLGSVIFYFFYIYFRSIQKLKWLFGGIAVFGCVLVLVNSDIDIYLINQFNSSHLPEKYNQYQDLSQPKLEFKKKDMELLFDGCTNLKQYLTPQNNLIVGPVSCKTNIAEGEQKKYYKFNSLGNVVTKYNTSSIDEILFEGYLINVNEKYYRSWAFDNDTLKRKIETYNENFSLDTIRQNAFVVDIWKNATFLFSNQCNTEGATIKSFKKITFLKNNRWSIFYYDAKTYQNIVNKGIAWNDLFRHYSKETYEWLPNYNKNIQYQYFQKIKLYRFDYGIKRWDGYLYTNVIVGKDTLKIKEALTIDNGKAGGDLSEESQKWSNYLYYSNAKLQYQLFTNQIGKLYIIKSK
jgi:hypothetical protein